MRIRANDTTRKIAFVAVDSGDFTTRETGLASFTVYASLDGGAAFEWTLPTIAELSAVNMPGVYTLAIDKSNVVGIDPADGPLELTLHITHAGMAPVTRTVEIYWEEQPMLVQRTKIATLTSQTVFTLVQGSADDDAYVGCTVVILDAAYGTNRQTAIGIVSAYVGATKQITLKKNPGIYTMAVNDFVTILPPLTEDVVLADSAEHGGTNFVLQGNRIALNSSDDHAFSAITNAPSKDALHLEANGTGLVSGLNAYGEWSGIVASNAAASAGNGMRLTGNGAGAGLDVYSQSGNAFNLDAPSGVAEIPANMTRLNTSAFAAAQLAASAVGIIQGAATGTPTAFGMDTSLTGYSDDALIDGLVVFTSGTAIGQRVLISDYASVNGAITFDKTLPIVPASGDTFVIV